jgi:hypothetical protein
MAPQPPTFEDEKAGVCRHEAGHFVLSLESGFVPGDLIVIAGDLAHGGVVNVQDLHGSTDPERVRAGIRVCLAGEVARTDAATIADFAPAAASDIAAATDMAAELGEVVELVLAQELENARAQVAECSPSVDALVTKLMSITSLRNGHIGLGAVGAARVAGYEPRYSDDGDIIGFVRMANDVERMRQSSRRGAP